jgi:hypothetical protein
MMPELLNRHKNMIPSGAVYIGRPSPFGNPFEIGPDGTRLEVIEKYKQWLLAQPELVARVQRELRGKDLVCWCAPLPCHGNLLLHIANGD